VKKDDCEKSLCAAARRSSVHQKNLTDRGRSYMTGVVHSAPIVRIEYRQPNNWASVPIADVILRATSPHGRFCIEGWPQAARLAIVCWFLV